MQNFISPSNIMFTVGIIATLFSIYKYFHDPQTRSDKIDALFEQKLNELEKQLTLMTASFQAHIISDNTQFATLNSHVVEVDKSVVRLTTIIEERIPNKSG